MNRVGSREREVNTVNFDSCLENVNLVQSSVFWRTKMDSKMKATKKLREEIKNVNLKVPTTV